MYESWKSDKDYAENLSVNDYYKGDVVNSKFVGTLVFTGTYKDFEKWAKSQGLRFKKSNGHLMGGYYVDEDGCTYDMYNSPETDFDIVHK